MIISEIYLIGIQRTNGNWNYARKRQDNSIEFVPFNEWNRDVVCFQNKEDAKAFWNQSKYLVAKSDNWNKYFLENTICVRKRSLQECSV